MENLRDPIVGTIPHRIVLTGGPLAGKSTVLETLQESYGNKIRVMSEVASMLLASGYPQPGRDLEFSPAWLDFINRTILPTQLGMENGHLHAALGAGKSAVVFDRGMLDPAAYMAGGLDVLRGVYGLDVESVLERYTMVIHLESLACVSTELYDKLCGTNPSRYDTAEQAIERDLALREAWAGHPNWRFVPAAGGIDAVVGRVLALLSPLFDVEIERKWLLEGFSDARIAEEVPYTHGHTIEQRYLVLSDGVELRIRDVGGEAHRITVKDKGGLRRTEWEQSLPADVYRLLEAVDGPTIRKSRFFVPHAGRTLELDAYVRPEGLYTLECEFATEREAAEFELPEWAAGAIDVTDDPAYKNAALAVAA